MSSWVLSSNPTTTYKMGDSLKASEDNTVDWISKNIFAVGDTVYMYEVLPPNGRGGIICKTVVLETDIALLDKIQDEEFWIGNKYPNYITSKTTFNRLRRVALPTNDIILYRALKQVGFVAPQSGAHLLDTKPSLLHYIESHFK